ncbi:hypothetical protein [Methylobacterium organophilum]|uniref:Uncharacterized protein n=1 Tax=Methylobacterium organophilum TaxID=410 RepID=A0ABQ4T8X0_METOR|nr:hypothetical protein [Methylobacterium organophilum]UMY16582.1 hypothetical protein MMB17_18100 [Methylobacterium organophilum]GJE27320.1 hypothetical protein LKMONMHP_2178 [Methylobacterium organophilum]
MNTRLASVAAALALSLALPASSAFAQSYTAPAGIPTGATVATGDVLTTGSIGPRGGWGLSRTQRAIDSSAKGGNAAQPNFLVPQYGNTAGGPAQ